MSHLLKTINPEAADKIENERALPDVGDTVVYHPRRGEIRMNRDRVPALVLWVDTDNRRLNLLVILGRDDEQEQDRVPEWNGMDAGWELKRSPAVDLKAVEDRVAKLYDHIFGEYEAPPESLLERLDDLEGAMEGLQSEFAKLGKAPAKVSTASKAIIKPALDQIQAKPQKQLRRRIGR